MLSDGAASAPSSAVSAGVAKGLGRYSTEAWPSSIGSMILMGLIIAALVWDRRRKMNR